VLEVLAAATDAERRETTTAGALASALGADERVVETHLERLADCELARFQADGSVRVTITGEELLEIEADGPLIVDDPEPDSAN
jgi:Mn-dependent DtxR family transcriptional regulator